MEARLELKLSQKLIMTPQLQQAIKLLQLSRLELVQSIAQEMIENPVLEEQPPDAAEGESSGEGEAGAGDLFRDTARDAEGGGAASGEETVELKGDFNLGPEWDEYIGDGMDGSDFGDFEPGDKDLPSYDQTLSRRQSLSDHLMWQLRLATSDEGIRKAGEWIIGNIDDDGYLRASLEELGQQASLPPKTMERALVLIQGFDPVGVGARSLQECLWIQVKDLGLEDSTVGRIVSHHLSDLEKKRYSSIAGALGVSLQDVMDAVQIIIHELEPKPGRPYADADTHYVVPDVYVVKVEDRYVVQLNEEGLPRVRINPYYRRLLNRSEELDKATKEYIEERLRSAQWLIKGMEQRNKTIYKVADSIVKFQQDFFEHGISRLKPMVLKDVADDISMHESTISRVTTNKYIHTPQGIFSMKFFFTTGFTAGSGEEISSLTIKDQIQKMIKEEDPAAPLKDQQIVDALKAQGINIARRTVAKYREELRIPPTSVRRRAVI